MAGLTGVTLKLQGSVIMRPADKISTERKAGKISTERKAGKISTEERATLRHLVRERDDALKNWQSNGVSMRALQNYQLASERLRAYREELGNG